LTGLRRKRGADREESHLEEFFRRLASPNAHLITGVICGYRIAGTNPLTRKARTWTSWSTRGEGARWKVLRVPAKA
jgi:hypothetical protein